jgi:hypothetical protein
VQLNDGGTRLLSGDRVFLNLGTHAAISGIPGLEAARPLTHIEALKTTIGSPASIIGGRGLKGIKLAKSIAPRAIASSRARPVTNLW